MGRKKSKKKGTNKARAVDTIIIEHLACLEINNLILQPPFHLISSIQWNDKGISFDGEIEVFSKHEIEKSNFINKVPVQIKGTTVQKTLFLNKKISHSVKKNDIEVYYKHGRGVLYFVVTINPITYGRQAYYRMLAPLELKALLSQLDASGNESISLHFKKLETGDLDGLCRIFLDEVKKQPLHFIEASKDMEFTRYKLNFIAGKQDSFNLFEEIAYIYGISSDNIEMPLEAAKVKELTSIKTEEVHLDGEVIDITYKVINTENHYKAVIENTLTFDWDKKKKSGNLYLGNVRTLGAYVKCLRLINYYIEHRKLPIPSLQLEATKINQKNFQGIDEEIKLYKELLDVCNQIGINENYEFHDKDDLPSLFNAIIDVFKNKRLDLLNKYEGEPEYSNVFHIELSEYVKLKLVYVDEKFINFYSEEAIKTIGGLRSKTDVVKSCAQDNSMPVQLPDNLEENYWKTSIYTFKKIEELTEDANFDFEIIKLSFDDEYYDIQEHHTIITSLDYMKYYDKSCDEKYLELALELNQRYLEKFPADYYAKVNSYLIKLKKQHELSEDEKNDVLDIQDRAGSDQDQGLCFACEVLLKNKLKAQRLFNSLNEEEKRVILEFPIYHFYENLK
ncbi:hypothetical protein [Bacillus pacificus]|uniref:hypothetical protein n=1 Tax=Bacillus pacificus TaxID=2026187 RepID=UPI000627F8EB|nr:hypothetical protein [Bacillus pacificus]HDR7347496.1 DUF4365 domain-containing protein [Bacillus toyonensis]